MKNVRKIIGFLLALAMIFTMAVPAFAAEGENGAERPTGTITINNAVKGQTYKVYKIFDLEYNNSDSANIAYLYKIANNSPWKSFFAGTGAGLGYVTVGDENVVRWINTADVAEFAKVAQEYAGKNGVDATAYAEAMGTSLVFNNLPLGYYLVTSTVGTLCSLDTTNPSVTIKDKNKEPTNNKEVWENSSEDYRKENDASIGDTVKFRSTIIAQAGAENYVFHDKMDAGLTFKGEDTIEIKIYRAILTESETESEVTYPEDGTSLLKDEDYSYRKGIETDENKYTFEIVFSSDFCSGLNANDKIEITYKATLNENAVIAGNGNKNGSFLSYGEGGCMETTPSETQTFTWKADFFKYCIDEDNKQQPLEGAEFSLYKESDCSEGKEIQLVKEDNKGTLYRIAQVDEKNVLLEGTGINTITTISTDATGEFTIKGLDAGTYYIKETSQPQFYNPLLTPIKFIIDSTGKVYISTEESEPVDKIQVLNQKGTELPSTGGAGTTLFYLIGGILAVGAAVLLVTKRRMGNDDE